MQPTIRSLLAEPTLRLSLLEPGADGALDLPVSWAHGSDLPDPTPFLDAGQVLLTTGTQFADDRVDLRDYVRRLRAAGVAGLGFGTEVATRTPPALVAECAAAGLPLVEVPYAIPFIAVARAVADRVAAAEHARDTWALGAMRAIAFSALRPDGLAATVGELARQLDRSVFLLERTGTVAAASTPDDPAPTEVAAEVAAEAVRLLARGQRSSSSLETPEGTAVLQTIGRRSELRGVLAVVGGGDLDPADQTVVTSVVALVGLALERGREVGRARASVRSAAIRALLDGRTALADSVLSDLDEAVPAGELVLARIRLATAASALTDLPLGLLAADLDGETVAVGSPSAVRDALDGLSATRAATDVRAGVSTPVDPEELDRADREARAALDTATADDPVVDARDLVRRGVDGLLDRPGAREIAVAVLRPLADEPVLRASLAAWLDANGLVDPAARSLGIHRHTLAARIATAERLLGRDLSTVAARTELWIALRASARP